MSSVTASSDGVDPAVRDAASHVTGDYYFINSYAWYYWVVGAVLTIALPPVGGALLGWIFVGSIKSESGLAEIDADALA